MELELKENEAKQIRRIGEAIFYGELIQLQHTLTKKYVAVSYSDTSLTEDTKLKVRCIMTASMLLHYILQTCCHACYSHLFIDTIICILFPRLEAVANINFVPTIVFI